MPVRYLILLLAATFIAPVVSVAQVSGCTDPLANNYSITATQNDGSCTYNSTTIAPVKTDTLVDTLGETSGLIWWNGHLWTHNDNADTVIYALDTIHGKIKDLKRVKKVINEDWEELAQDNDYVYLGDFGNNVNGNRQNLHILRIAKADFGNAEVTADTISFTYSDQTNFTGVGANNTDFDCEAFLVTNDSIYLFTKQWISKKTTCYVLPKTPGSYIAQLRSTHNVQGLITGATYIESKRAVILCGYEINSLVIQPFVYLLYDYQGNEFFSGNKRKIYVSELMSQVEGIASADGLGFYISNEQIINSILTIFARLQKLDLSPYLLTYYQSLAIPAMLPSEDRIIVYPNPSNGNITIDIPGTKRTTAEILITDLKGTKIWQGTKRLSTGETRISLYFPELSSGLYKVRVSSNGWTANTILVHQHK